MTQKWLFIDTHEAGVSRIGLLEEGHTQLRTVKGRQGALLPALALRPGLAALKRVEGICVVAGPGSFSAIRGGVLVANLLARWLGKPLVGVSCEDAGDPSALTARLLSGGVDRVSFVSPVYDAEPNITKAVR